MSQIEILDDRKRKRVYLVRNGKKYDVLEAVVQDGKIVLLCYKRAAYAHLSHRIFEINNSGGVIEELKRAGVKVYTIEEIL